MPHASSAHAQTQPRSDPRQHRDHHPCACPEPGLRLRIIATLLAFGWTLPTLATATERMAVPDIKPLLMRAAQQGESHGVLTGVGAAYMQRRFATTGPIEIDVRRLHPLPQNGCARLEVSTGQRDALVEGQRQDQKLVYSLSFCADGSFPKE